MTDVTRPISTERLRKLATITSNIALNAESAEELRALAATILQQQADLDAARGQADAIAEVVGLDPMEPGEQPLLVEVAYHVRNTMESHRRLSHDVVRLTRELDQERTQHKADLEGADSAIAQEAHEKSILEQVETQLREERDRARRELVVAMQTIELNAATGPCLYLCDQPSLCASCGRTRKDGRKDRRWVYPVLDVSRALRFSVRVAFCAKCFDELEARAAKHTGKEQREQPGELGEVAGG